MSGTPDPIAIAQLELEAAQAALARAREAERRAIAEVEALERGLWGMVAWLTGSRQARLDAVVERAERAIRHREQQETRVAELNDRLDALAEQVPPARERRAVVPVAVRRRALDRARDAVRAFRDRPTAATRTAAHLALEDLRMVEPVADALELPTMDHDELDGALAKLLEDLESLFALLENDEPDERGAPIPPELLERARRALWDYHVRLEAARVLVEATPMGYYHKRNLLDVALDHDYREHIPFHPTGLGDRSLRQGVQVRFQHLFEARERAAQAVERLGRYAERFEVDLWSGGTTPDDLWINHQKAQVERLLDAMGGPPSTMDGPPVS